MEAAGTGRCSLRVALLLGGVASFSCGLLSQKCCGTPSVTPHLANVSKASGTRAMDTADFRSATSSTSPQALFFPVAPASLRAATSRAPTTMAGCKVTAYSQDGIGHQIEGKLSCIAMADFFKQEYVHVPMYRAHHGADPARMETFFGLGTQFRNTTWPLRGFRGMVRKTQLVGKCNRKDWWTELENGTTRCHADSEQELSTGNNCWDRMYCFGYMESGHWYRVVPAIQRAYYSSAKPDPDWTQGFSSSQSWGPKVAVHIRKGDSIYKNKLTYYLRQIDRIRSQSSLPPLIRIQTDDAKLVGEPSLMAANIAVDGPESDLELAIHRMVTADVLIMSRSALSMTAALIGNQSTVIYPACFDRALLPHWTKASCV